MEKNNFIQKKYIQAINKDILPPWWVTAFIDGEGGFHVGVQKNDSMKLKKQVQFEFSLTQNNRDSELMEKFIDYFNAGNLNNDGLKKKQYRIRDLKELDNVYIHLDEYPLLTKKILDYHDFRKVHDMMKQGLHLTPEGLEKIEKIKNGMGRNRNFKNELD